MTEIAEETIQILKGLLEENRLSVIVGAGFSKNASPLFLSWRELLKDMIIEMYGHQVGLSVLSPKKRNQKYNLEEKLIDQIILENGYLGIASEYIRRMGYREAMDDYIEKRTPYVKKKNGNYALVLNEKEYENVDLTVHNLLLDLDWNNVYTFNYDNLLDIAGRADEHMDYENKIATLQNKVEETQEQLNDIKKLMDSKKINTHLIIPNNSSAHPIIFTEEKILTQGQGCPDDEIEELTNKKQELLDKIREHENQIAFMIEEQKKLYHIVDSSSKISLRKDRNIYKLHGSLRCGNTDEYGFDYDCYCNYIISAEDYTDYPQKHDAFVTLMRIALLQDSFCLIGFSGDDPNFLSWLGWVKDILDRRSQKDTIEKIYFIDVSGHPLDRGKNQFFKNHYIKYVPLFNRPKEVNPLSIQKNLTYFLSSLKGETDKAENAIQQYNKLWTDMEWDKQNDENMIFGVSRNELRMVWDNLQYNRLPKLSSVYYNRMRIISHAGKLIGEQSINEDTAKMICMAVMGELLPIDELLEDNIINSFLEKTKDYTEIRKKIEINRLRYSILKGGNSIVTNKSQTSDEFTYELILKSAFNLDFTSFKQKLLKWQPENIQWKGVKTAIETLFGEMRHNKAMEIIANAPNNNSQEFLYLLEILKKASGLHYVFNKKPDKIQIEINKIKRSQISSVDDNFRYLTEKLSQQKMSVFPYGSNRRIFKMGGYDQPLVYSIQLLQTIIGTGIPLRTQFVVYYNKESWYTAFKNLFTRYPYPCLFYSLQYGNDKDFMKRIAQDYVYTNKLKSFCKEVFNKILQAYLMPETPLNIKEGILSLSPLFFKYIPNASWQSKFEKIYDDYNSSNHEKKNDYINPIYNFFIGGVEFSKNKNFKIRILIDMLQQGEKIDDTENRMIIASIKNFHNSNIHKDISLLIDNVMREVANSNQFYVLFNLKRFFTDKQKKKFVMILLKYDFKSCSDSTMLEASCEFAKDIPILADKLTSEIVENRILWRNGIEFLEEEGKYQYSHYPNCIDLDYIQKKIQFSKHAIEKIYNKLITSLNIIIKFKEKKQDKNDLFDLYNFNSLLLQMRLFLRNNKNNLIDNLDYTRISKTVDRLYKEESKSPSIMDALISNNTDTINKGLIALSYDVEYFGLKKYYSEYLVIANNIINKSTAGLSGCVFHFSSIMKKHYKEIDRDLFSPFVGKILDVYENYFTDIECLWDIDANKETVERAMIDLNKVAKKWNVGNLYWNSHKRIFPV